MKRFLLGFLAGAYLLGAVATFVVNGFLMALGGNLDVAQMIAYPLFWPIVVLLFLIGL